MKNNGNGNGPLRISVRLVLWYLVLGTLWIVFSDRILELVAQDTASLTTLQTYKGWFFILITSIFLFLFSLGQYRTIQITKETLSKTEAQVEKEHAALLLAINAANVGLWDWDLTTNKVSYSKEWKSQIGYSEDDIGNDFSEWERRVHPDDLAKARANAEEFINNPRPDFFNEFRFQHKDGSYRWILAHASMIYDGTGKPVHMIGSHIDVTPLKETQRALFESEERFRRALENIPDVVVLYDHELRIQFINEATRLVTGRPTSDFIGKREEDIWPAEVYQHYLTELTQALISGQEQSVLAEIDLPGQNPRTLKITCVPLLDEYGNVREVLGITEDLTERLRAEEVIQRTIRRLERAEEIGNMGSWRHDPSTGETWMSRNLLKFFDLKPGKGTPDLQDFLERIHPDDRSHLQSELDKLSENEGFSMLEFRSDPAQGTVHHFLGSAVVEEGKSGANAKWAGTLLDVTNLKQTEMALQESEARYQQLIEKSPIGIAVHQGGKVVFTNPRGAEILGAETPEQLIGKPIFEIVHPDGRQSAQERIQRMLAGEQDLYPVEDLYVRLDGSTVPVEVMAVSVSFNGQPAVQVMVRDISKRKEAEESTFLQIKRLNALRMIDKAISTNFELSHTLQVLLDQVVSQLNVDAAVILLLNKAGDELRFAEASGVEFKDADAIQIPVGIDFAGQAIQEKRTVHIQDIPATGGALAKRLERAGESFQVFYGVPLIMKGTPIGVLEIFHHVAFEPEKGWIEFLETLAQQAALAIHEAQQFEGLQKANEELFQAYDATIEGWSRALDLRDKETEGHTQRVTSMALELAEAIGMPADELIHFRRGALLHDIGKLGVPDHILFKPDNLTDEEWGLMKRHPEFAHDMLKPITYLKPALDIPYCHHERWDGSGYPRGLSGEDIPLAARIFAVIDVWDALRSDRPYRPGWELEKVIGHIKEQSGSHFDPRVVEKFIEMQNN